MLRLLLLFSSLNLSRAEYDSNSFQDRKYESEGVRYSEGAEDAYDGNVPYGNIPYTEDQHQEAYYYSTCGPYRRGRRKLSAQIDEMCRGPAEQPTCKPKYWANPSAKIGGEPNTAALAMFYIWIFLFVVGLIFIAAPGIGTIDWVDDGPNDNTFYDLRKLVFAGLVGLCAGFINSNTDKRFGTVGGYMTGRTMLTGMAMADNNWSGPPNTGSAFYGFAAIGAFFGGSFVAAFYAPQRVHGSYQILALVVILLYLIVELVANYTPYGVWWSVLSPFAQGIMSTIAVSQIGQPITFQTGRVWNLARGLAREFLQCFGKGPKLELKVFFDTRIIAAVYFSFMIGSMPGVWVTTLNCGGDWTLLIPAVIYGLSTFYVESEARPLLLVGKKPAELATTSLVPPRTSTLTKRRNYMWATEPLSDDLNNPNLQ